MSKWHISGFADEMSPELGIQLRELNRLGVAIWSPAQWTAAIFPI